MIGSLMSFSICVWLTAFSQDVQWRRLLFAAGAALCALLFAMLAIQTMRKAKQLVPFVYSLSAYYSWWVWWPQVQCVTFILETLASTFDAVPNPHNDKIHSIKFYFFTHALTIIMICENWILKKLVFKWFSVLSEVRLFKKKWHCLTDS